MFEDIIQNKKSKFCSDTCKEHASCAFCTNFGLMYCQYTSRDRMLSGICFKTMEIMTGVSIYCDNFYCSKKTKEEER